MPLIIPKDLIGEDVLSREKIFTMDEQRASTQDIRPLKVAIVNLMPKKKETELQLIKMLSNTSLQINIDLIKMGSYEPKNTEAEHLNKFYKTFDEIKNSKYDAMIITGAPVEKLEYEKIIYWDELKQILDYAKENVFSTMFICWSAQAALYHYYGIKHNVSEEKIFGVFEFEKEIDDKILKGIDDEFSVPTSRYTYVKPEQVKDISELKILAKREDAGVGIIVSEDYRFIFNFGHWEYDRETLNDEYVRDLNKNLDIKLPVNYYRGDDVAKGIKVSWKAAGNLFFSNWLNYCVYQETPYNIEEIKNKKVAKFGGSSLSDASQFSKVKNIIELKSESDVVVVSAPGKRNREDTKVTDSLIDIANLNLETRDLSNLIRKMEIELAEKRSELKSNLNDVKKRFYNIAKELKSEICFDEIDCVFKSIKASVSKEFIVSRGEYLNAKLMADYLNYEFVDAKDLIVFNADGNVDYEKSYSKIVEVISCKSKVVVPGFYGSDEFGNIRTFKRGGSDYTGSIIASALNSEIYENWTDVDGIMTGDPKLNKDAKTIRNMNYQELVDIVNSGAQVYQKDAIEPVKSKNITIRILNTNSPDDEGTIIKN
ncbi:homoserine O-succinyltransferase [Peptoniphilus asaccharolyticus DSM 20463]|uniref:Homoserine O-acetyltransferase n=1 Tax=Peptoniphilus asaccharolyticus DSM 20463 TaxID=573058 RepID=A0A1W1VA29_PEPAS|nr:homoserine O-succinyltransferase [Peptoniphilus asaccharolyticus]MBL7575799.1 homoserine O-succinyltransferase [Peptoniphilus asaccharolyticus]SMB89891.1 homoserine O-succinyltransferase [Peptoniphilus asaccharolyticus DSM 20463]